MWWCLAPVAHATRAPRVGRSYGRTPGGGRGEDGDRRDARMRAPRLRRQVCTAESCYRSPVKGRARREFFSGGRSNRNLGAPAASPGCRPGWPGAAGLIGRRPSPATRFSDLKINNLREKEQCRVSAADRLQPRNIRHCNGIVDERDERGSGEGRLRGLDQRD
jgi:hypothetical protein